MTVCLFIIVSILAAHHRPARRRRSHLHARFAGRAAAVSGDLTDVVSNIGLVRAFGAAGRERTRLSRSIAHEMSAQRKSLRSLERLRLFHAVLGLPGYGGGPSWAVMLWRDGRITTGDVVLTTTLGFTVLHASRDLAMAMVDLVQHFAKLGEAVRCWGCRTRWSMRPMPSRSSTGRGGELHRASPSAIPTATAFSKNFNLEIPPGPESRSGRPLGLGQVDYPVYAAAALRSAEGKVLIDGQDIAHVTQDSLRRAIAVVHQDISLFHRSVLENLRYGKPEATDEEVYRATEAAHCTEFIKRLPQGFAHHRRRARPEAFGWTAPAHRHCPRLSERCADHPARRSDLRARHRIRAIDPGSADAAGPGPHGDRRRPPSVHAGLLRSHHRPRMGAIVEEGPSEEFLQRNGHLQPDVPAAAVGRDASVIRPGAARGRAACRRFRR